MEISGTKGSEKDLMEFCLKEYKNFRLSWLGTNSKGKLKRANS